MMLHCALVLPHDFRPIPPNYITAMFRTGYYGVSMFFVISGFLITAKVLQRSPDGCNSRFSVRAFYVHRLGRIFPCLVLMVSVALTLSLCRVQGFTIDPTRYSIWQMLNYIFTFRFNTYPGFEGLPNPWKVLWSLSIEEVFYLSFPILFGALKRPHWIVPILIVVIAVGPFRRSSSPGLSVLYDYFSCFDLIALGSLTAFISSAFLGHGSRQLIWKVFRGAGLAVITLVYFRYPVLNNIVFGPSLIGLGAAIYLLGAIYAEAAPPIKSNVLGLLDMFGQYSYELYLFHFLIIMAIHAAINRPTVKFWNPIFLSYSSFGLSFVISFLVSALIARTYSEPVNKYIRRVLIRFLGRLKPSRVNWTERGF
jgi:peptidoglycan/LPS O-acetylase OafA/YrhL